MKTSGHLLFQGSSPLSFKIMTVLFSILITSVNLAPNLQAQTKVKQELDSLLSSFPQSGPGGVVVVLDQSKIIYSGTYGFANVEWNIPNALDVKYRIGSITKTFTAMAILQLAEKRKLSLDDKVIKWLPEINSDDRVTIKYLLSNTSGIQAGKKELEFNPGERLNYSNYGYMLLGQIIAKVSGISYEQYLKENVFAPLGMSNSGYDHNKDILQKRASGYRITQSGFINAAYSDMEHPGAAGGLYSTVQDMITFEKSLNGNSMFPKSFFESAYKPFVLNNGNVSNYGFGWLATNFRGWRETSAGGDIEGFNSFFAHFPDKNRTVIVIQNITMQIGADWSGGGRLAHHIIDMLWSNELQPVSKVITLPMEKLQLLTGIYEFKNAPEEMISAMGPNLTITAENGILYVQDKNNHIPVAALSSQDFIVPNMDISVKFVIGSDNRASDLTINFMGLRELYATRTK
jgi:CubicO group peptidase (beta-lactamase class C family)